MYFAEDYLIRFIENDDVKFNLDYRKAPKSKNVPERIQKSATMQTDEIPTISSAITNQEDSSVSKIYVNFVDFENLI
jgi:hypothetical protein